MIWIVIVLGVLMLLLGLRVLVKSGDCRKCGHLRILHETVGCAAGTPGGRERCGCTYEIEERVPVHG